MSVFVFIFGTTLMAGRNQDNSRIASVLLGFFSDVLFGHLVATVARFTIGP